MTDKTCLLLFLKYPVPGQVKTRLGKEIGYEAAAELYRQFVENMLDNLHANELEIILCFDSEASSLQSTTWLDNRYQHYVQTGQDLGERMANAFRFAFSCGFSRALLVGTDIPDLPPAIVTTAVSELFEHTVVIGPTDDGGYYLIGMKASDFVPAVFFDISWSTDVVFAQTLSHFKRLGIAYKELSFWHDVDVLSDLYKLNFQYIKESLQIKIQSVL